MTSQYSLVSKIYSKNPLRLPDSVVGSRSKNYHKKYCIWWSIVSVILTYISQLLDRSPAFHMLDDIIRSFEQNGQLLKKSAILFWRFHQILWNRQKLEKQVISHSICQNLFFYFFKHMLIFWSIYQHSECDTSSWQICHFIGNFIHHR